MAKTHGTFTRTIDGRDYTMVAYSPADAVRYRFNGWTEQKDEPVADDGDKKSTPTKATKATKAAAK